MTLCDRHLISVRIRRPAKKHPSYKLMHVIERYSLTLKVRLATGAQILQVELRKRPNHSRAWLLLECSQENVIRILRNENILINNG